MNDTPEAQTYIHALNALWTSMVCFALFSVIFLFLSVALRCECIRFQFLPSPLRRPNYSTCASVCVCDWVGERVCEVRVLFILSANEPKRKEIAELKLS